MDALHTFKRRTRQPAFDSATLCEVRGKMHHGSSLHGQAHWHSVLHNAYFLVEQELGEVTPENEATIHLFALFHDSQRFDDGHDDGHGGRGAVLLASMRPSVLRVSDPAGATKTLLCGRSEIIRAMAACAYHTEALPAFIDAQVDAPFVTDTVQQICFDSDRLDLPRAGTIPSSRYLFTDTARRMADGKTLVHW